MLAGLLGARQLGWGEKKKTRGRNGGEGAFIGFWGLCQGLGCVRGERAWLCGLGFPSFLYECEAACSMV